MDKLKKLWNVLQKSGSSAVYKILKNRLKRQLMKKEHIVLKYQPNDKADTLKEGLCYEKYARLSTVPESTKQELYALSQSSYVDEMLLLFDQKAVFWVIYQQDLVVGYWWSTSIEGLRQWYLLLNPEDLVFFAAWVAPVWRGQAIAPSVLLNIINTQVETETSVYLDVETWNESGINAWKKAGFIEVGIYPPLPQIQKA
ncbi:MAG: GNAT family N-acetyltransferase [Methylococcales bacterium]|nr:GNAT family N-acetyltransferase [Methylococcales bacterium]